MKYKYHLLKYSGKQSRLTGPECGRHHCFTPYVDENDQIVSPQYGRCDHESSCGYVLYPLTEQHYQPQHQNRILSKTRPKPISNLCTIPQSIVQKTIRKDSNHLGAFPAQTAGSAPARPGTHSMPLRRTPSETSSRPSTQWTNATGRSVYTCKGQTASDQLADCLCQAAIKNFPGRRIRTDYSDGDHDWEENFYILRHSLCPAVLTENFFMDGLDFEFLQSKACKQAIVDTHIEGIIEYIESTQSDSILRNLTTT